MSIFSHYLKPKSHRHKRWSYKHKKITPTISIKSPQNSRNLSVCINLCFHPTGISSISLHPDGPPSNRAWQTYSNKSHTPAHTICSASLYCEPFRNHPAPRQSSRGRRSKINHQFISRPSPCTSFAGVVSQLASNEHIYRTSFHWRGVSPRLPEWLPDTLFAFLASSEEVIIILQSVVQYVQQWSSTRGGLEKLSARSWDGCSGRRLRLRFGGSPIGALSDLEKRWLLENKSFVTHCWSNSDGLFGLATGGGRGLWRWEEN